MTHSQRGGSAIVMVMLMFTLGLLLLAGLQRQVDSLTRQSADEQRYWLAFNQGLSSLAWGLSLNWPPGDGEWHCQSLAAESLLACLRTDAEGDEGLLRGEGRFMPHTPPLRLYQKVAVTALADHVQLQPLARGWLDFCPETEEKRCADTR